MGCADYRLYCDGDSDSDGNGIMYWVLNKKKSVLEFEFPERFGFFVGLPYIALATQHLPRPMSSSMNFMG